jgi:imidazolonepropionase-like amidohydrolase
MRRCLLTLLFLLPLGLLGRSHAATEPQSPLQPTVFALKNVRVHLDADQVFESANVIIRDGLIEGVGKDYPIPPDAVVLADQGLIVYPGFVDAASSWGIDPQKRPTEAASLDGFDLSSEALAKTPMENRKGLTPQFQASEALKIEAEALEGWQKQGIVARLVLPGDALLAGQSALVLMNDTSGRKAVLRNRVAIFGNFHRWSPPGYPTTLMGNIGHVRQFFLDVGYHARLKEAYEERPLGREPSADPALEAMEPVLKGRLPLIFAADTADEIHRALDFAAEFQLKPIIWGGAEAWKVADRLQKEQVMVVLRLDLDDYQPPRRRFSLDGSEDADRPEDKPKLPARVEAEQKKKKEQRWKTASVLAEKKVRFAFGSHGLKKNEDFLKSVRQAIEAGLPAKQALAALTTDAATILHADRQLGRITPGGPAHLVVMNGDFDKKTSTVRYLFVDGKRTDYAFPRTEVRQERGRGEGQEGNRPERGQVGQNTPPAQQEGQGRRRGRGEGGGTPPQERRGQPERRGERTDEKKAEETKTVTVPDAATETEEDRQPKTRTGGNCLLKGATILTVTNGTKQGDILIRNGKIAALGTDLPTPDGVKVIDAAKLFVMPGIIDTHCHFAMAGGVNEASLSAVPEVRVRDIINSEDVNIYRALAGGMTTARLLHGSANCIGGQDAVIKLKFGTSPKEMLVADAPRGIKFALGENVKRSGGRFPNTRLGVEAVLVRAFTEADEYRRQWKQYEKEKASKNLPEPRRDLRLEALADILDGKLHIHCHCYRSDEILMLLRVADRFGFKIKSLQHCLEGYKVAPEIAAHGASISTFSDWWAYKIEAYDAIPHNAALVQEAGGLVCLKSDSNELMRHLYQEAAKMQKYGGMSETDALKTITLNAAKQLGLDSRIGSIEVGKDADLAIFNGHPLDGFARCVMTLVEGEVYFESQERQPIAKMELPKARKPEQERLNITRDPNGQYMLSFVTVHTVSGPVIEGATVFIQGGKIRSIATSTGIPKGYTEIDARGLHLYPGMIDSATILGLTELGSAKETQDYAEGGDFQPDLRAVTGINPDSELIPVTRSNGVLAVVTRPTGAMVAGQSALINLHGWVPQEMAVVEPLALHIDFPMLLAIFNMNPNGPQLGRAVVRKQRDLKIRRMKELFEQARRYDRLQASKSTNTAKTDPRLEALLPYVRKEKPVVVQANRKDDILAALELSDSLQVNIILSGALDAWKVADELKKRKIPVLLGPVMHLPTDEHDPFDGVSRCAAVLHQHGVQFAIRTEGGPNSRNLPYEAAMAVSYGLPAEEGLKAVTLYPAKIFGVADKLGSIEEGKIANLILTDGDILQPTTQVKAIFINGVPVDTANKQTRLYEKYRQRLKEVGTQKVSGGTPASGSKLGSRGETKAGEQQPKQ